jgi:hypothetical protein
MNANADLLTRVAAADPMPWEADLPADVVDAMPTATWIMREGPTMIDHRPTERMESGAPAPRRPLSRGLAIAIAVAVVILVAAIPAVILWNREAGPGADGIAPATEPAAESTTTTQAEAEGDAMASLSALLDRYYEAYNSGDVETVFALLSPMMREVNPTIVEYWIGTLGEQVDATCTPLADGSTGVTCFEEYTDPLHAASGTRAVTRMQYFERNGLLFQAHDANHLIMPGCQQNRCPGTMTDASGAVPVWSYEAFEADFYAWLETSHPEVATMIGDASAIAYYRGDHEATLAVLPYVEAYARTDPAEVTGEGADLSAMSTLEAVEALYAALNSRDAGAFEAFFGTPPDDAMEWFWAQGRIWNHECVDDGAGTVTCEIDIEDDFYTRAGAVFRHTEEWTLVDGTLFDTVLRAESSGHWAYHDFEADFASWMAANHPDEAAIAFIGSDFVHTDEAATIAMARLDAFLVASDEYPRDADPRDDYSG